MCSCIPGILISSYREADHLCPLRSITGPKPEGGSTGEKSNCLREPPKTPARRGSQDTPSARLFKRPKNRPRSTAPGREQRGGCPGGAGRRRGSHRNVVAGGRRELRPRRCRPDSSSSDGKSEGENLLTASRVTALYAPYCPPRKAVLRKGYTLTGKTSGVCLLRQVGRVKKRQLRVLGNESFNNSSKKKIFFFRTSLKGNQDVSHSVSRAVTVNQWLE